VIYPHPKGGTTPFPPTSPPIHNPPAAQDGLLTMISLTKRDVLLDLIYIVQFPHHVFMSFCVFILSWGRSLYWDVTFGAQAFSGAWHQIQPLYYVGISSSCGNDVRSSINSGRYNTSDTMVQIVPGKDRYLYILFDILSFNFPQCQLSISSFCYGYHRSRSSCWDCSSCLSHSSCSRHWPFLPWRQRPFHFYQLCYG
jgi:hypothetical protein